MRPSRGNSTGEFQIDARAIIDPAAKLGANVEVGPWSIIGPNVELGDGCRIGPHAVVTGCTRMGRDNRVYQFATIGEDTPALAYRGEPTRLEIGDGNTFREGVTVHRGTVQDQGVTRIGSRGLFMAYVHIGHDCVVGDQVVMANNASVSGHCVVGDYANFGGYVGVPQRRRIGAHTHLAGMSLVLKDVPAYVTVAGNPAFAIGLNLEGMRRRGVSDEVIGLLRTAYKTLYRCGLTVEEACERLAAEKPSCPEVALLVDSVLTSEQGIVRPRPSGNSGR